MNAERTVDELMTVNPRVLHRNDVLTLADEVMKEGQFRHLPVLDEDEELCGVVSERDIFRGAILRALGYGGRAEARMLQSVLVKEVMTRDLATVTADAPIGTAAELMLVNKIGCLPVLGKEGKLVGLITETDLLSALTK